MVESTGAAAVAFRSDVLLKRLDGGGGAILAPGRIGEVLAVPRAQAVAYAWRGSVDELLRPRVDAEMARSRNFVSANVKTTGRAVVSMTCAGVYPRTVTALLSLSGHVRGDFDVVVAASPRPGDETADALEAAGFRVLRQPRPVGLTDLWNRAVADAANRGYAYPPPASKSSSPEKSYTLHTE